MFITEEGRWECCDGGVDGGSWDELWLFRAPGDLDGELARYSNKSAPSCLFVARECIVDGGVRGGDDDMILLDDGWWKECIGRSSSSSCVVCEMSNIGEPSGCESGIVVASGTKATWLEPNDVCDLWNAGENCGRL